MIDTRDALEGLALAADHLDLAHRQRPVCGTGLASLHPGDDQPVLRADRQPAEKHPLNEREHHRGAGNAGGQRQHRRGSESSGAAQSTPGKPAGPATKARRPLVAS